MQTFLTTTLTTAFVLLLLACSPLLLAQPTNPLHRYYPADSIQKDMTELFEELSIKHPGYYRYTDTAAMDAYMAQAITSVDTAMTGLQVYRLLKPLFAKIGCVHTAITLQDHAADSLLALQEYLPLQLYVTPAGKAYVTKSYLPAGSPLSVVLGSEVTAINGQPMPAIYAQLVAAIPMDGNNTSGKTRTLQYNFAKWYHSMLGPADTFIVEAVANGQTTRYTLPAVVGTVLPTYNDVVTGGMAFNIANGVATLRIPSFAKSYLKRHNQQFKKAINGYFKLLRQQKVQHLIVDLRGNTGGTDTYAAYFTAHFFEQPFRYWQHIEVTEAIAEDIKGFARVFYAKPEYDESSWLWKKTWFTKEFNHYELINPAKEVFTGQVYVLTDGLCLSSCGDVAAILHHNKKAVFIGEETGGGYQGNTSGLIPTEAIGYGLQITVPLLKYVTAVNPTVNIGRGTLPSYPVLPTIQEVLDGHDPAMQQALQLIEQNQ